MGRIESWLTNPSLSPGLAILVTILGCILTSIGIILTIWIRKKKRPVYCKRSFNIIRDFSTKISKLEVLYEGESVNNLTITKIAFWNDGSDTINGDDIPKADPLRITAPDNAKILDSEVIYSTNPANVFHISNIEDDNSVRILFDYLDKMEGGVIKIIHTGGCSEDIEFGGTIKGVSSIKCLSAFPSAYLRLFLPPFLPIRLRRIFGFIMLFGCLSAFLVMGLTMLLGENVKSPSYMGWVITIAYGLMIFPLYLVVRRRIPKQFHILYEL